MRTLILVLMLLIAIPSYPKGDLQVTKFKWKADNDVEIDLSSGRRKTKFMGLLREGEEVSLREDAIELNVRAYSSSFVSLIATQDGETEGRALFLERINGRYRGLNPSVPGHAQTLKDDLHRSVTTLEQQNGWDHSIAIRSILSYFAKNPKKMINDFLLEVNEGHINTVAKPQARWSGDWDTKAIRGTPDKIGSFATGEEKKAPKVAQTDTETKTDEPAPQRRRSKRTTRRQREPLPYEPRFRQRRNPGLFNFLFGN